MATDIASRVDLGLVWKVSDRVDQLIMGLVLQRQGKPRTIGAEG